MQMEAFHAKTFVFRNPIPLLETEINRKNIIIFVSIREMEDHAQFRLLIIDVTGLRRQHQISLCKYNVNKIFAIFRELCVQKAKG